jgi:hypothetical protein
VPVTSWTITVLTLGARTVAIGPIAAVRTCFPVGPIAVPALSSTLPISVGALPIRTIITVAVRPAVVLAPRAVGGIPPARRAIGLMVASSTVGARVPLRPIAPARPIIAPCRIATARPVGTPSSTISRGIPTTGRLRATPRVGPARLVRAARSGRSSSRPLRTSADRRLLAGSAAAVGALVGVILPTGAITAIGPVAGRAILGSSRLLTDRRPARRGRIGPDFTRRFLRAVGPVTVG